MRPRVEAYANKRRDAGRERELTKALRALPDEEVFEFVQELLLHDLVLGLEIAKSSLRAPAHAQLLLERGLAIADASEIKLWLRALVPKLGVRRVLSTLDQALDAHPRSVARAVYWMGEFIPDDKPELAEALRQMILRVRETGAIPGARMRPDPKHPGRVVFDPIDDW